MEDKILATTCFVVAWVVATGGWLWASYAVGATLLHIWR